MGNLFSKKHGSRIAPEPSRKPSSAPARLEGLDGVEEKPVACPRPASTPADVADLTKGLSDEDVAQIKEEAAAAKDAVVASKPRQRKVDVVGKQSDGSQLAAALPTAIVIPESAQHWTQALPERVVRMLHSADWKDREQGLTGATRAVLAAAAAAGPAADLAYAIACEVLAISLKDKVAPLYHASLDMLQQLLGAFAGVPHTPAPPGAPRGKSAQQFKVQGISLVSGEKLRDGANRLVPQLVHRCGNLNARIHEASLQALLALASYPELGPALLAPHVLGALPRVAQGNAAHAAQLAGRLGLVSEMLAAGLTSVEPEGGSAGSSTLNEAAVLNLCRAGLDQADEKARQAGVRALVEVHRARKLSGQAGLSADTCVGAIKPALAQLLTRRFAEVDADPTAPTTNSTGAGAAGAGATGAGAGSLAVAGGALGPRGKQLPPLAVAGVGAVKPWHTAHSSGARSPQADNTPGSRVVRGSGLHRSQLGKPWQQDAVVAASAGSMQEEKSGSSSPAPGTPATPSSKHKGVGRGSRLATPALGSAAGAKDSGAPSPSSQSKPGRSSLPRAGSGNKRATSPAASQAAASPISQQPSLPRILDDQDEQLIQYIMTKNADLTVAC